MNDDNITDGVKCLNNDFYIGSLIEFRCLGSIPYVIAFFLQDSDHPYPQPIPHLQS